MPDTSNGSSTNPDPAAPLASGGPGLSPWGPNLAEPTGGCAAAGNGAPRCPPGCSAPAGWETGCQHERASENEKCLFGKGRRPPFANLPK